MGKGQRNRSVRSTQRPVHSFVNVGTGVPNRSSRRHPGTSSLDPAAYAKAFRDVEAAVWMANGLCSLFESMKAKKSYLKSLYPQFDFTPPKMDGGRWLLVVEPEVLSKAAQDESIAATPFYVEDLTEWFLIEQVDELGDRGEFIRGEYDGTEYEILPYTPHEIAALRNALSSDKFNKAVDEYDAQGEATENADQLTAWLTEAERYGSVAFL